MSNILTEWEGLYYKLYRPRRPFRWIWYVRGVFVFALILLWIAGAWAQWLAIGLGVTYLAYKVYGILRTFGRWIMAKWEQRKTLQEESYQHTEYIQ